MFLCNLSWGLTLKKFCKEAAIVENNIIAAIFEDLNHPSNHLFSDLSLVRWL